MARLPGAPDLGPTPRADPARPVGSYDVSGYARGGAAIAAGMGELGKGFAKAGEGMADYQLDENRWDYAKAHSNFLTNKVDIDAAAAQDPTYGPDASGKALPARYTDSVTKARDDAAALIKSGPMRERFLMDVAPTIEQGVVKAQEHARAKENNASVAYVSAQGDALTDRAIAAPDDATRTQLIDSHNQLVDGLVAKGAVTPTAALEMKRSWAHQYATADLLHRADTDPEGVVNELRLKPGSPEAITARIMGNEGTARSAASSAQGHGGFTDETWLNIVKQNRPDLAKGRSDADILALRADKGLGREMTEANRAANEGYLRKQGIDATPGAQYLAHFLGPAGAAAVLKADPKQPVADVLADAVGPDKAQQMIDANPSILGGKLAGSVKQWSDGKMGGAVPGGASIYSQLRPDVREQILSRAETQLGKQQVNDTAAFDQRYADTRAQAFDTGTPGPKPLTQSEFIGRYGATAGPIKFKDYQADLAVAAKLPQVAAMTDDEQREFLDRLHPKEGDQGYATRLDLHNRIAGQVQKLQQARTADPAAYAIRYQPAVQEAWGAFSNMLRDPQASEDDRRAAARDYATKTNMEMDRLGMPADGRQLVPKAYTDNFNKTITGAADSDDAQKRIGLVNQVQREAALWGDNWPGIMRQLAPNAQPIVRAIAAGADPTAMTRLLSVPKDESPAKILKEQNETKFKDLTTALNTTMKPFADSLVGRQKDRDYPAYYGLAEKLSAIYVRDGKSASDAAAAAFNDLVGNRYDFRDTYRIPKSAGAPADDIQAGVQAARDMIMSGSSAEGGAAFGIKPAVNDIGLADPRADSLSKFSRDGVFITAPDNAGLNLTYGGKFVRHEDGAPLLLTWSRLAELGGTPAARAGAIKKATDYGIGTP